MRFFIAAGQSNGSVVSRILQFAGLACAGALFSASVLARDTLPQISPGDVTSDSRLSSAVGTSLAQFVADYNAGSYERASGDLAAARALPGRTAYDEYRIDSYGLTVATARKDYSGGAALLESMLSSPALGDKDRLALYGSAVSIYSGERQYWRAIQFGERLNRENGLDPATAYALADTYLLDGSYADAERVSQAALNKGIATDDQRKALGKVLDKAQIDLGEKDPGVGEALFGAMLAGAAAGFAQALTGQQADPSTGMPMTATQRKGAAQDTERQAQQQAAAEILAQNPATERAIYSDLLGPSGRLSAADRKRAARLHDQASQAYQKQDYASAEAGLQSELAIEPANAEANYYYADCLARGPNQSLAVVDYLARVLAFDRDGESGSLARQALQGISSPPQSGQN
jgi:hypothetical protein